MKFAVNLYFANGDTKQRLNLIKNTGYDGVLLGMNEDFQTMTVTEQLGYCKEIGLEISMVHANYDGSILNEFWEKDSAIGDEIADDIIRQIQKIKDYNIKNFVIHVCGDDKCKTNEYGIMRLKKILNLCEEINMNLCIENLFIASQLDYIYENIKSKNLKFCYDSGHENFLTPNENLAERFSKFLTATHLHDNHGSRDEHKILGTGTVNQEYLAKSLAKADLEFLTAEIKYYNEGVLQEQILKDNMEVLKNLAKKMNV